MSVCVLSLIGMAFACGHTLLKLQRDWCQPLSRLSELIKIYMNMYEIMFSCTDHVIYVHMLVVCNAIMYITWNAFNDIFYKWPTICLLVIGLVKIM